MTTAATLQPQVEIPDKLGDLGITPPDWNWIGAQKDLAHQIANSPKKIIMLEAECGTGKSVIPIAAAASAGKEATVLIRTVHLQEQYLRDIKGLTMLTGRARYTCDITGGSAEWAPCVVGVRCSLKGQWRRGKPLTTPDCSYFRQKATAALAQFRVLNYAYWLREIRGEVSTFHQADWIVCDEGHELEQVLMDAGTISLNRDTIRKYCSKPPDVRTIDSWMQWGAKNAPVIDKQYAAVEAEAKRNGLIEDQEEAPAQILDPKSAEAKEIIDRFRDLRTLRGWLNDIKAIDEPEKWACDQDNRYFHLEPAFGAPAFKKLLACAREKVIIMSAFLAPQALMRNLNLNPDDVEVIQAPEVYDRKNSQIYFCPTVKMGYKTQDHEWRFVAGVIDMIANTPALQKKKGIIHVPSVALRDRLASTLAPNVRSRLVCYDGADTDIGRRRYGTKEDALKFFTETDQPMILLGQSVSTGVDLPHVPQWQIITKLSFPPFNTPALALRHETDKFFMQYLTLCEVVQAAGRIKRAQDHDGPTFILDSNFGWFSSRMREHMPSWFRRALVKQGWDRWTYYKQQLHRVAFQNGVIL